MKRRSPVPFLVLIIAFVCAQRGSMAADAAPTRVPGVMKAPAFSADFLAALRSGELQRVRELLEEGASPQARDALGNTALMHAAVYADPAVLGLLLERGADPNATNHAGATPLHRAAVDSRKVSLLLQHGARPNIASAVGNTPLMLAARPGRSHKSVRLLLEHGADANATNVFGATALMAAAAGGDFDSGRLLLRHGANPNARPILEQTGFLFGGGRTPLMWAAFRGNLEVMKALLEAGADVNQPGLFGTALSQAVWADRGEAAEFLLQRGADPRIAGFVDGYNSLHWAASGQTSGTRIASLLLQHGADPNLGGGENVDAFLCTLQTPLMLARRNGNDAMLSMLRLAGATQETPDRVRAVEFRSVRVPDPLDVEFLRGAVSEAVVPLQRTSLFSKESFVRHASRQDCTSCHQQHLPMAAVAAARGLGARVDEAAEQKLIRIVHAGELKDPEIDLQPLFHPDPVLTKGYELFAFAAENLGADDKTDVRVHHLAAVQGPEGQWHNNLPRPPIQTGDIGATALAVQALRTYPLPGRAHEFAERVQRARQWLWKAIPGDTDSRIYQLLGLAWAGETTPNLKPLAESLLAEQRADGGWGQLPGLAADAYATGQAVYALRTAAGYDLSHPAVDRGLRFLLKTQLSDGTWHVRRRAFPFQPTMDSGFPHGRDAWISAAATSWAVMALSLPEAPAMIAGEPGGGRTSASR